MTYIMRSQVYTIYILKHKKGAPGKIVITHTIIDKNK